MDEVQDMHLEYDAEARAAYAAYVQEVGGLTYDGKPIPPFGEIKPKQRNGWRIAAKAVKEF